MKKITLKNTFSRLVVYGHADIYFFLSACLSRNNVGGLHGPASQYAWPNSGLQLGWVGSCYFAAGLVSVSQYILFPSGSRYQLWSSPFSLPVCQIQHFGQWPFISKYDAVGKWQGPSQEVVVFFEQMCFLMESGSWTYVLLGCGGHVLIMLHLKSMIYSCICAAFLTDCNDARRTS